MGADDTTSERLNAIIESKLWSSGMKAVHLNAALLFTAVYTLVFQVEIYDSV